MKITKKGLTIVGIGFSALVIGSIFYTNYIIGGDITRISKGPFYEEKAAIRKFFGSDKKAILEYQQYRIGEFIRYHNYDTSYASSVEDWYQGQNATDYQDDDCSSGFCLFGNYSK